MFAFFLCKGVQGAHCIWILSMEIADLKKILGIEVFILIVKKIWLSFKKKTAKKKKHFELVEPVTTAAFCLGTNLFGGVNLATSQSRLHLLCLSRLKPHQLSVKLHSQIFWRRHTAVLTLKGKRCDDCLPSFLCPETLWHAHKCLKTYSLRTSSAGACLRKIPKDPLCANMCFEWPIGSSEETYGV